MPNLYPRWSETIHQLEEINRNPASKAGKWEEGPAVTLKLQSSPVSFLELSSLDIVHPDGRSPILFIDKCLNDIPLEDRAIHYLQDPYLRQLEEPAGMKSHVRFWSKKTTWNCKIMLKMTTQTDGELMFGI
jgi:hypothetical protein